MAKNVRGHFVADAPAWRRAASAIWRAPDDPTVSGTMDLDASRALAFVRELSERTGERVTITHLVTKALAQALRQHPECNAFIRKGRLFRRDDVDVFVLVAVESREPGGPPDADLSGIKLEQADRKSLLELARTIRDSAKTFREGDDAELALAKTLAQRLPQPFVRVGLRLVTWLQYEHNVDLSRFGIPRDTFGCALVTSVGRFGIGRAFAPLVPVARFSTAVVVGHIEEKPVAESGQVVIRPILPLTATFDHRVVDGFHAARLCRTVRDLLLDPEHALAD
jgi:pyruvate dehydrogenase E2 component (dihydrolipoamide acetyltransferase)